MDPRIREVVRCVITVVALVGSGVASAQQLVVTVTSGVESRIPIAVVPFGWSGPGNQAPFDVAAVVEQDLSTSGYFEPLERRNMISQPSLPTQINLQDWRLVDVETLLIGQITPEAAGRYTIEFHLYDIVRGSELFGFQMPVDTADDFRSSAHRIADMVYENLTGVRGVFNTRIAYITEEHTTVDDRTFRLIVADADGENAQVIAESSQPLMSPAWSPDGRRIAYVSFEDLQSAVYIQTVETGTRQLVSRRAGVNASPAFSPDGRMLALTLSLNDGNLDIYTLDLSNQVLHRITQNAAIDSEASWSADGQYLYFMSDRRGSPQIYRVRAEPNNEAQRISFEGTYNARPRVSPDGKQLAVIHRMQSRDRIAMLDPETSYVTVLSQGTLDESPSFAPNGAMLIYATRDGGRGVLATVSADGRIHQEIKAAAGDVREPVWSPYARP